MKWGQEEEFLRNNRKNVGGKGNNKEVGEQIVTEQQQQHDQLYQVSQATFSRRLREHAAKTRQRNPRKGDDERWTVGAHWREEDAEVVRVTNWFDAAHLSQTVQEAGGVGVVEFDEWLWYAKTGGIVDFVVTHPEKYKRVRVLLGMVVGTATGKGTEVLWGVKPRERGRRWEDCH